MAVTIQTLHNDALEEFGIFCYKAFEEESTRAKMH